MAYNLNGYGVEQSPSDHDRLYAWRIRRADAIKPLGLVLISENWFGIRTHYYGQRTIPHLTWGDCPGCRAGVSRWNGYLLAFDLREAERIVWEFTPAVYDSLVRLREEYGTLRGLFLKISRVKKIPNGRLQIEKSAPYTERLELPASQDIVPIIFRIWGVALPDGEEHSVLAPAAPGADDKPTGRPVRRRSSTGPSGPEQVMKDLPGQLRAFG